MSDTAAVRDILVGIMIISIMVSVGLDLAPPNITAVFRRPKVLLIGLLVNHVLVPLCAWGICRGLGLSPAVTAGLMLVASAPGGPVGTILVVNARGELALSVSLVVVMTLINTTTTPLTLNLLGVVPAGSDTPIGFWSMAQTIAVYQIIPLTLAMSVRHWWPSLANQLLPFATRFSKGIFALVFIGLAITQSHHMMSIGTLPLLAVELVVAISLLLGAVVPPGPPRVRATVCLNSGVRNLALSLLLATLWFPSGDTLLTAMIYGLLMLLNGVPLSFWWRRRTA